MMTRPTVLAVLILLAAAYVTGWWRFSRRRPQPAPRRRLALALGALATVAIALASPLDRLAHERFVAHMIQHLLLMMVAAPLLLLADVFPIVFWSLPKPARHLVAPLFARGGLARTLLRRSTAMPVAWLLSAVTLWGWHLPALYDRALTDDALHDLEHLSFFMSAIVFWWPVIDPAPRLRRAAPHGLRIVYLVLAAFQNAALGLVLMLAPDVLYPTYAATRPASPLSPLEDQAWGGIVMWSIGGVIDMAAVLVLLWRFLVLEERNTKRPFLDRSGLVREN